MQFRWIWAPRSRLVGSYQTQADRIRITARIVDAETGEAVADAKVDGPLADAVLTLTIWLDAAGLDGLAGAFPSWDAAAGTATAATHRTTARTETRVRIMCCSIRGTSPRGNAVRHARAPKRLRSRPRSVRGGRDRRVIDVAGPEPGAVIARRRPIGPGLRVVESRWMSIRLRAE